MEQFISRLRSRLKNEPVLENQAGTISQPSSLVMVPYYFTDGGNPSRPLLDEPGLLRTYVSPQYLPTDLRALGLVNQTAADVYRILSLKTLGWIKERGSNWHSRLAAGVVQSGYNTSFRAISLIPLRDGRWISANDGQVYFPNTSDNIVIPQGIEVNIIDESACACGSWRQMFIQFGAQTLNEKRVWELILERHQYMYQFTDSLPLDCMINHAWYLFCYGSASLDCKVNEPHLKLDHQISDSPRVAFSNETLVALIALYPNRWLSIIKCRWRAPPCLTTVVPLQRHFSHLRALFVDKIGLKDAGSSDVLDELLGLPEPAWREKQVKDLLLALSGYLNLGHPLLRERFRRLARKPVIPVRLSPERMDFRYSQNDDWFIADRPRYSKCFTGKVWLLDFDEKQTSSLEPVIEQLVLTTRLLSKHVRGETITCGESVFHSNLTSELQAKASYVSL